VLVQLAVTLFENFEICVFSHSFGSGGFISIGDLQQERHGKKQTAAKFIYEHYNFISGSKSEARIFLKLSTTAEMRLESEFVLESIFERFGLESLISCT
jgi:hypothetical protein